MYNTILKIKFAKFNNENKLNKLKSRIMEKNQCNLFGKPTKYKFYQLFNSSESEARIF